MTDILILQVDLRCLLHSLHQRCIQQGMSCVCACGGVFVCRMGVRFNDGWLSSGQDQHSGLINDLIVQNVIL